jgi:hypothetical protein
MDTQPSRAYGTAAYLDLLQKWVESAFLAPNAENRPDLNATWLLLASSICGGDQQKLALFGAEIGKLAPTGREGDPPAHAFRQRLSELVAAGIQEGFLSIAMRDATTQAISLNHSSLLDQWVELAEAMMPTNMRFSDRGDTPPSHVVYGPA